MDCRAATFITDRIPHRPPFLWLDRVLEMTDDSIIAEKKIPEDLDLFQGHYPDYPLFPGPQRNLQFRQQAPARPQHPKPVLTRILGAKFKREVRPGDVISVSARLMERVGSAWFLKGSVRVDGKVAVQVEFGCILKE